MTLLNLMRSDLLHNHNYIPGGACSKYRLHANELPWAPVTKNSVPLNFYPDSQLQLQVLGQLAARYQEQSNQLVLTRGSDDAIDLVTRLFINAGQDALMQFNPTFPMYAFYVRLQQGELIRTYEKLIKTEGLCSSLIR